MGNVEMANSTVAFFLSDQTLIRVIGERKNKQNSPRNFRSISRLKISFKPLNLTFYLFQEINLPLQIFTKDKLTESRI